MKPPAALLGVGLAMAGCLNLSESEQKYCESVTPATRAEICQDGPHVVSLEPIRNATGVALDAGLTVTFDQGVYCDSEAITLVQNSIDGKPVLGTTACSRMKATFTATGALLSGRFYKATLTDKVKNDAGTPALTTSWNFTAQ